MDSLSVCYREPHTAAQHVRCQLRIRLRQRPNGDARRAGGPPPRRHGAPRGRPQGPQPTAVPGRLRHVRETRGKAQGRTGPRAPVRQLRAAGGPHAGVRSRRRHRVRGAKAHPLPHARFRHLPHNSHGNRVQSHAHAAGVLGRRFCRHHGLHRVHQVG